MSCAVETLDIAYCSVLSASSSSVIVISKLWMNFLEHWAGTDVELIPMIQDLNGCAGV